MELRGNKKVYLIHGVNAVGERFAFGLVNRGFVMNAALRRYNMEKPPVLSEEEIKPLLVKEWVLREEELLPDSPDFRNNITLQNICNWITLQDVRLVNSIAQAQHDADVEHYEPIIANNKKYVETLLKQNDIYFKRIEQARQDTAREVAKEIEGFLQMHLYARPDKPMTTMKFSDWQKLRKLLSKYLGGSQ